MVLIMESSYIEISCLAPKPAGHFSEVALISGGLYSETLRFMCWMEEWKNEKMPLSEWLWVYTKDKCIVW